LKRIDDIKIATKAENVFIRIPPLLVPEKDKQRFEILLNEIILQLRSKGVPVLEQKYLLLTDASLFCDAIHHPNFKGRALLTSDLISAMKNQTINLRLN
jgi:hypothetical protein